MESVNGIPFTGARDVPVIVTLDKNSIQYTDHQAVKEAANKAAEAAKLKAILITASAVVGALLIGYIYFKRF